MRRYLLDTGPLTAFLQGRPAAVALIDPWLDRHEAVTSILSYGEAVEHLASLPGFANRKSHLRQLLREIVPCALTYSTLERYAAIRRALRPPHGPGLIEDVDTLIAATALVRRLTVVTTDEDFARVPELDLMLVDRQRLRA
jgi:predicted nucleic acid-binding protein